METSITLQRIQEAAQFIREQAGSTAPSVGLVLGTIFLRDAPEESRDIDEFFRKANTPS